MNKLFKAAPILMLVGMLLTSCGTTQSTTASPQAQLPKNFSLPIYPGATTRATNGSVILASNDEMNTVAKYYREQLASAGWTVHDGISMDRMTSIEGLKNHQTATVNLTWDPVSHTTITLAVM